MRILLKFETNHKHSKLQATKAKKIMIGQLENSRTKYSKYATMLARFILDMALYNSEL